MKGRTKVGDLEVQLTTEAMVLVTIIGVLVQQCKRVQYFETIKEQMPIYVIIAIVLGMVAAYLQKIPNPYVTGVVMGLMAAGAYSVATKVKRKEIK